MPFHFVPRRAEELVNLAKKAVQKYRTGGWQEIFFALQTRLRTSFGVVLLGLPCALMMRLFNAINPWCTFRIGVLNCSRVGHLVANTEYWLRRESLLGCKIKRIDILLSVNNPANYQYVKMLGRKVRVIVSDVLWEAFRRTKLLIPNWDIWIPLDSTGAHDYKVWNSAGSQLSFTDEEKCRGAELLRTMGIGSDEPFVCFSSRDSAYLDQIHSYRKRDEWSYQDYRDCDINNYLEAAEYLAGQGIWMLRMGQAVRNPLTCSHPKIIDYATKHRTDFGDVYLMSHCKFVLCSTEGLYALGMALNDVPCAATNNVPIGYGWQTSNCLQIPKRFRSIKLGHYLTYAKIIEIGADKWTRTEEFESADIECVENTPHEILDLAIEMNSRLDNTWMPGEQDKALQALYWSMFPQGHPMKGIPSRIGAQFLRENKDLLS